MKNYNIIFTVLFAAFFILNINNSNAKNRFHAKLPDKNFNLSSKSKTVIMEKGETYRIKAKLRENRYYFFSAEGNRKRACLQYRIIDPNNNNEIIFDNSAYEFINNITFLNKVERNVIIEIITMPCYKSKKRTNNVKVLFANKKMKGNEEFDVNRNYNLYAVK